MTAGYKTDFEKQRIIPFQVFGNLYYVGTRSGPSYLIATTNGLILLDTGMPQTRHLLFESMWEMGFDPRQVKYIIHSHGHIDHIGGTRAVKALSGAKTFIGAGDEDYVNGKLDLTWAKELGFTYDDPFEADQIVHDGEVIRLGETEIKCVASPGHTPGVMSYFLNITDGKKTYRAGTHGGVGIRSMSKKFLDGYGLSHNCRNQFLSGLERLKSERVDVFFGNHLGHNDALLKLSQVKPGAANPFIDPTTWLLFLEKRAKLLLDMIEKEERASSENNQCTI